MKLLAQTAEHLRRYWDNHQCVVGEQQNQPQRRGEIPWHQLTSNGIMRCPSFRLTPPSRHHLSCNKKPSKVRRNKSNNPYFQSPIKAIWKFSKGIYHRPLPKWGSYKPSSRCCQLYLKSKTPFMFHQCIPNHGQLFPNTGSSA